MRLLTARSTVQARLGEFLLLFLGSTLSKTGISFGCMESSVGCLHICLLPLAVLKECKNKGCFVACYYFIVKSPLKLQSVLKYPRFSTRSLPLFALFGSEFD